MSYAADTTLVTTGMLPALMLASAALTAPVSLFLLRLYRRAVLRSMAAQAGTAAPADVPLPPVIHDAPPLEMRVFDAAPHAVAELPVYRYALRSLASATTVYVAAGVAYTLVLTGTWLVFTRDDGMPLTRVLWLLSCYLWPTALAVGMLAAVSRRQRLLVACAYFGMLFAVALYGLFRSGELRAGQLITFWLFTNAPATVLLVKLLLAGPAIRRVAI